MYHSRLKRGQSRRTEPLTCGVFPAVVGGLLGVWKTRTPAVRREVWWLHERTEKEVLSLQSLLSAPTSLLDRDIRLS